MNWQMISAIVDSIGALAVVISLVYLGLQIRAQNRESRVASVHEISEGYRSTMAALHDPELAALFVKGNDDYDSLEPFERMQLTSYCMVAFKLFEEAFYQRQQQRLDEYIWEGMVTQLRDSLATLTLSSVWQLRRHQFGEDFRAFVDSLARGTYAV